MNTRAKRTRPTLVLLGCALLALGGCASEEKQDRDFFTSGSREADQRAEQRIARSQQLKGEGEAGNDEDKPPEKQSLYERLGGEQGIAAIVDDFVARAMADPRVNWERKGVERGGVLGIGERSAEWKPDPGAVEQMKKHIAQFITLATGGPAKYEGRDMKELHKGLKITNPEFDAAVGDLKATLDKMQVATEVQKELLAIIESTRPQIVEQR